MSALFYLITAAILFIPLFWEIKHEKQIKPTFAGKVFIVLVLLSIVANIMIDRKNKINDKLQGKTIESLLHKIDSLSYINSSQYDSIFKMQQKLDSTIALNRDVEKISQLQKRPLVKLLSANIVTNGSVELRFVNDGEIGATNFQGDYLFLIKSLENSIEEVVVKKTLPLNVTDIITDKDDYVRIDIPTDIFKAEDYLDRNWIYLVIRLYYSDITNSNHYIFEATSRLRKSDNGRFSGCYNYEHDKYINLIKK